MYGREFRVRLEKNEDEHGHVTKNQGVGVSFFFAQPPRTASRTAGQRNPSRRRIGTLGSTNETWGAPLFWVYEHCGAFHDGPRLAAGRVALLVWM